MNGYYCNTCKIFHNELEICQKKVQEAPDLRQQPHYTQHKIQPATFIGENKIGFLEGNVIKYVCRYNLRGGVEDLEKARHYLDMLIQREKEGVVRP